MDPMVCKVILPIKTSSPEGGHPVSIKQTAKTFTELSQEYFCSRFYPSHAIWKLFTAKQCREFAFFILVSDNGQTGESCIIRKLCFLNYEDFVQALATYRPIRIESGAVYLSGACRSDEIVSRELVFDIDIDSYDKFIPMRSCGCVGSGFCRACWPFVNIAARVIVNTLHEFGVAKVGVFYSGGRGLHIRAFSNDATFNIPNKEARISMRTALLGKDDLLVTHNCSQTLAAMPYIFMAVNSLITNQLTGKYGMFTEWLLETHPGTALAVLYDTTQRTIVQLQNFIGRGGISAIDRYSGQLSELLVFSADVKTALEISRKFTPELNSARKECRVLTGVSSTIDSTKYNLDAYNRIVARIKQVMQPNVLLECISDVNWQNTLSCIIMSTAMLCLWPRIDGEPTYQAGHLLRVPMGIHLSTGRLGVRVGESELDTFYPSDASPQIMEVTTAHQQQIPIPLMGRDKIKFDDDELAAKSCKDFETWVDAILS